MADNLGREISRRSLLKGAVALAGAATVGQIIWPKGASAYSYCADCDSGYVATCSHWCHPGCFPDRGRAWDRCQGSYYCTSCFNQIECWCEYYDCELNGCNACFCCC